MIDPDPQDRRIIALYSSLMIALSLPCLLAWTIFERNLEEWLQYRDPSLFFYAGDRFCWRLPSRNGFNDRIIAQRISKGSSN